MSVPEKVLIIDDDELIASMLARALRSEGYEVRVETSAHQVVEKIKQWSPAVTMLDIRLPDRNGIDILEEMMNIGIPAQVVMLTADDTAESAVRAMKLGAVDYLTKPFNIEEVKIIVRNSIEKVKLTREVDYLRKVNSALFEHDIIGKSPAIGALKSELEKMANADVSTILITGESGTGKELLARYAHRLLHTGAEYAPFVSINCAALPETLLESELFGYEKGAFTDAKSDRKGLFEQAEGGTILLDEIGEMKQNLQSKLLRVLEERIIRRVGGSGEIPIDVTVIATTNRDLSGTVEKGEFRMDLFYRLNTFSLPITPLRDRREDIPLLAKHFLYCFSTKYNKKAIKGFSSNATELLTTHSWPGNVRELKNIIERIVVLESSIIILPEHLPKEICAPRAAPLEPPGGNGFILPEGGTSLEAAEKSLIIQALERARHNKTQAAKLLQISYDTLRYQVKKLGLE
ncbi:MAG TPA: sigma-54-dependent Fis family transcriptional regulator [Nitrospiraceae bacterium]|nr:sigma-54-dependent Fis family transcriptional regulator [Nitrospiraceae bacterium]